MYTNKLCHVKWGGGDEKSASLGISNSVKQGGVTSPLLFSLYIDELFFIIKRVWYRLACWTNIYWGCQLCPRYEGQLTRMAEPIPRSGQSSSYSLTNNLLPSYFNSFTPYYNNENHNHDLRYRILRLPMTRHEYFVQCTKYQLLRFIRETPQLDLNRCTQLNISNFRPTLNILLSIITIQYAT